MIKDFNENNINQGYDCSSCDPFMILLCELLKININYDYNGNNIQYMIDNSRKLSIINRINHILVEHLFLIIYLLFFV